MQIVVVVQIVVVCGLCRLLDVVVCAGSLVVVVDVYSPRLG